jgi:hypothetical protein
MGRSSFAILDRRRFLIGVQILLGLVSATLLVLAQTNSLTVESLIALTFVGGIGAALLWWRRQKAQATGLEEQFFGAFRAGLRYARASRELHVVLLRAAVFFLFASSVWALLPLVARQVLGGTAGFYGVLLGAVGAGAIIGAVGLVAAAVIFHRVKLPTCEADLQPSNHWPEPLLAEPVAHDCGPVMIQIEYRIRKEDRGAFLRAVHRLSQQRRRDGVYAWGVAEHSHDPEQVIEWFMVESWAEHLRQHQRVSHADADLQSEALRYHVGPDKPAVHHYLALGGLKDEVA